MTGNSSLAETSPKRRPTNLGSLISAEFLGLLGASLTVHRALEHAFVFIACPLIQKDLEHTPLLNALLVFLLRFQGITGSVLFTQTKISGVPSLRFPASIASISSNSVPERHGRPSCN